MYLGQITGEVTEKAVTSSFRRSAICVGSLQRGVRPLSNLPEATPASALTSTTIAPEPTDTSIWADGSRAGRYAMVLYADFNGEISR
jgi:hypothetical protein